MVHPLRGMNGCSWVLASTAKTLSRCRTQFSVDHISIHYSRYFLSAFEHSPGGSLCTTPCLCSFAPNAGSKFPPRFWMRLAQPQNVSGCK